MSDLLRVTSLYSGLDTQSIVTQMVSKQQAKVDSAVKKQKQLEVKMSEWKELNVRVCENDNDKTYLGIYLGDFVIGNNYSYNRTKEELSVIAMTNPTIFIPELNKIVFGMESWWYELEKPEDLQEITNEDIDNVWYVQALKMLSNNKDAE